MWTVKEKESELILHFADSKAEDRQLSAEVDSVPLLCIDNNSTQLEVPELDFENEAEEEGEHPLESFLFVEVPKAPFEETFIKMELDSDGSAIKQECVENNAALLPDEYDSGFLEEDENMVEKGVNSEEIDGESNATGDNIVEIPQNENSVLKMPSGSCASGRKKGACTGEIDGKLNAIGVYDFDDDIVEILQNENSVSKMLSASHAPSANSEEIDGKSNTTGLYEFDDDIVEIPQNENSVPKMPSASHASGRKKDANSEEINGNSNVTGVCDFDDDIVEIPQNGNSVSKLPSARHVTGRLQNGEEGLYSCDHCPRKFRKRTSLHQHIKMLLWEMSAQKNLCTFIYTCRLCSCRFPDLKMLNNHLNSHKFKKRYACNLCLKEFQLKQDLNDHLELHMFTFACPRCPAKFRHENNLRIHEQIHYDKPLSFATSCAQLAVRRNFESFELELYQCSQCPAKFKLKADLKNHQKEHKDSFQRSQFPAKVTGRDDLHKMTTHEEELSSRMTADQLVRSLLVEEMKKNFQNAQRKKSSSTELSLFDFDSSKFPHKCKFCPAKFIEELTLAKHVTLQHHDQKHRRCTLCNKTFQLSAHLKMHLKMCAKEKSDLSQHLKSHFIQPPPTQPIETGLSKSPSAEEPLPFSLAQEIKKNFANIKLRLSKAM